MCVPMLSSVGSESSMGSLMRSAAAAHIDDEQNELVLSQDLAVLRERLLGGIARHLANVRAITRQKSARLAALYWYGAHSFGSLYVMLSITLARGSLKKSPPVPASPRVSLAPVLPGGTASFWCFTTDHSLGTMSMDNHGLASDHGFLPTNKLEREISRYVDGIEDEDGKTSGMLRPDDENMKVVRPHRLATGAKGVMNDARQHYAMFALQQQADVVRQREINRRLAGGGTKPVDELASEEEEDDEEDEEFMRYRLQRLQQMQQAASASARLPTFGAVEPVEALDYPAMVDNAGSDQTFVVVHLHEEYLPASMRLHYNLEAIAAKYDQVRFLSVCAHDAKETIDDEELPMLIVYQAGQYLGSEDRVGKSEGASLTQAHVEDMLRRMRVRLTAAAAMREADSAALQRMRDLGLDERRAGAGVGGGGSDEDNDENEED